VTDLEPHLSRTIVVVDDSIRFLILVRSMLREFGFEQIHDFTDPAKAFQFASRVHVDVILTDLVMKPVNGFQFADRVRHADVMVNRVVPIILMTAHADHQNIKKAIVHGIDEVLAKPFSARQLHNRLKGVFDKPRVYIKTPSGYFGPDRRRREDPTYTGPERRRKAESEIIDHAKLLEMREEVRRKYGKAPPSPLEPEELKPLLVGPIMTIPVSVISTPAGPRPVARVPTPMRPPEDAPLDLTAEAAAPPALSKPLPESATRAVVVEPPRPVPVAPTPPPAEPKAPAEVHLLD
jgi:CheY-like chemotaxis protein